MLTDKFDIMKIIKALIKPWVFALIGGLLILGSSFLSGVTVLGKDSELRKINERIRTIENNYARADHAYDMAGIKSGLYTLQITLARLGFPHDEDIQSKWDAVHIAGLYVEVLLRHTSCGRLLDNESIKDLEMTRDKAIVGDNKSLKKLQEMAISLTGEAGHYLGNLIVEKAKYENELDIINSQIVRTKEISIIFQLLGLVVLLLKELPESIYQKFDEKHNKALPADS